MILALPRGWLWRATLVCLIYAVASPVLFLAALTEQVVTRLEGPARACPLCGRKNHAV